MSWVVGKLWGFCNTLRHDGMGYGDYIEQLTYLLFLKIAQERGVKLPNGCTWDNLKANSGTELLDAYQEVLRTLSKQKGMLGDIFAGSLSNFREPVNLKKLIGLIDETRWTSIDVDIKAEAYEGLLQKYAEEEKGAGQYFTPREAIRCVVRCMKPDIREKPDFTINDPAVGTAGFLIGAYEWMMKQTKEGAILSRAERDRLTKRTFSGCEIVLDTRRLALMNLYLHEIEVDIYYGDSLAEGPHTSKRYDVVMTNPPFGSKGAGQAPVRDDFAAKTPNKQLNFVQHVMNILKPGGRAAMVVPDNVLFDDGAGKEVRKLLMEDCNLHTILRLPIGTFTPYSTGVKANVIFFVKGEPTKEVWIYDNRTNVEKVAVRHPLTAAYFEDFEKCYVAKPRKQTERFRGFTLKEILERDGNLDIFLKGESTQGSEGLRDPRDLATEALGQVQAATDAINDLLATLSLNSGKNGNRREWKLVRLQDVVTDVQPGFACGQRAEDGYVQLRMNNIGLEGHVVLDKLLKVPKSETNLKKYRLEPGDVLFNNTNSPDLIGKTVLFRGEKTECVYSNHITRIRVNESLTVPEWVTWFLMWQQQEGTFERMCHRFVGQAGISRRDLLSIALPLPPMEEQKRLVATIGKTLSYAARIAKAVVLANQKTNASERSVLAKAFRGELVQKDLNDELAPVLPEKKAADVIKRERKSGHSPF